MAEGLLLSDDLLFGSRITATSRAHGLQVAVARTPEAAIAFLKLKSPHAVIFDLQLAGLDLARFVGEARAVVPSVRLVGYGSHVEVEALKLARQLGVTAMPRSQFAEQLEAELPGWLKAAPAG